MGGTNGYCRPVQPTDGRMSSWTAHTNRGVPSVEPGTDYYCPIGTPIRAAASGRVVDIGTSIQPATGFYVTIDLDDGRRVRYLHLSRIDVHVGKRVQWGEQVALSGATGYGEWDWSWNVAGTGGAHVHMTLWAQQRYTFGRYATLDPEQYMSSNQGGGNASTKETDMDCMILINGKIYALAPGFVKHCDSTAQVSEAQARGVKQHDYTGAGALDKWVRALDFYGIPRDAISGNGYVLNPQSGKHESGGLWTWSRAVLAKLK